MPSIEQPPKLEQKPLPNHLRYAYLGESSTFLVIISSSQIGVEENKLLRVLRHHKDAIGMVSSRFEEDPSLYVYASNLVRRRSQAFNGSDESKTHLF